MRSCRICHQPIDVAGHIGRRPAYCSPEHRREGERLQQARLRSDRRAEVVQLRQQVATLSAALAA